MIENEPPTPASGKPSAPDPTAAAAPDPRLGSPLASHQPPRTAPSGCLLLMSLGCGGFLVLAMAFFAFVYFGAGFLVTRMQGNFIRGSLERSGAPADVVLKVEAVLEDYDRTRQEENLSFSQWKLAASHFARSPAAMVLGIQDAKAGTAGTGQFKPEEEARVREVFDRLARGVAEGKIASEDLVQVVERSRGAPPPGNEGTRPIEVSHLKAAEEVRRLLPEAETLIAERAVPSGPFTPDLPALLQRDLSESLAKAKRGEEPPPDRPDRPAEKATK